MIERSHCGSGGCMTCPFSFNEESEIVHNYACLPTGYDIIELKKKTNQNWTCHGDETVICGGYAKYLKENHPKLSIKEGGLISYETWYIKGEKMAVVEAKNI